MDSIKKIKTVLSFFLLIILCYSIPYAALSNPEEKRERLELIKIGHASRSVAELPVIVAIKKGFFREQGIKVQMIQMRSSIAIAALISGHIDYTTSLGSTIRAAAKGAPLKAIMGINIKPLYYMMSRPDIDSPKDLKGRTIGISALGGTHHKMVKELIRLTGLDPDKDVNIIAIGEDIVRLQQLKQGAIDATMLTPAGVIIAKKTGFKIILEPIKILDMPQTGIGTQEKRIADNPSQVKKVIRSVLRGLLSMRQNKDETVQIIMDYLKIGKEEASESYDLTIKSNSPDGGISEKGIKFDLSLAREELGMKEDIPLSKIVDFSILREIQKELKIIK